MVCSTFDLFDFMRVPLPAARTTQASLSYTVGCAPFPARAAWPLLVRPDGLDLADLAVAPDDFAAGLALRADSVDLLDRVGLALFFFTAVLRRPRLYRLSRLRHRR